MILKKRPRDKYRLYEEAVQCPEAEIDFLDRVYRKRRGAFPATLREDFCGGAAVAAEFVRRRRDNRAFGVDLDAEVLARAEVRRSTLGGAAARLVLRRGDVLCARGPKVDAILALNFSYFIFHERNTLLRYFRAARAGLKPGGLLVLDTYGGAEALTPGEERRDGPGFTYVWRRVAANPVDYRVKNAIDFEFRRGKPLRNAFVYDWRYWPLPDIQDTLRAAGFSGVTVYAEGWDAKKDEGDGRFRPVRSFAECASWIAYLVAER